VHHDTWPQTALVEPESVHVENVQMASSPQIAVVFDRNTPKQIGYSFSPQQARSMAAGLEAKASLSDLSAPKH
jgi:cytochrome c oxidase assembly protein Cox11